MGDTDCLSPTFATGQMNKVPPPLFLSLRHAEFGPSWHALRDSSLSINTGVGSTQISLSTKPSTELRLGFRGMVHCPDCDQEIAEESDVKFVDLDAKMAGIFRSSKRFYIVACNNCEAAIGSGVAGGGG